MSTYSLEEIKDPLSHFINLKMPVLLLGPTGLGKSSVIHQIAEEQNRKVIDIRLSQIEYSDLRGIPHILDGIVKWSSPHFLPQASDDTSIIFLDEINCAHQSILSAAYQLILDRKIGDYTLPEGVSIVAAGNRMVDNEDLTEIPKPLMNRFVHFEVKYEFKSWLDYATKQQYHPIILTYLNGNKSELFTKNEENTKSAFATPRTWERVSKILCSFSDIQSNLKLIQKMIVATIGEAAGEKFSIFLRTQSKVLFDFKKIITDDSYKPKNKIDANGLQTLKQGIYTELCVEFGERNLLDLKNQSIEDKKKICKALDLAIDFMYRNCDIEFCIAFIHAMTKEYKINVQLPYMPLYSKISKDPEVREMLSNI